MKKEKVRERGVSMDNKFDIALFHPCIEGMEYYRSKPSFESAWNECERGDFMLWMASKLRVDDRLMARAKALCANTVRHLMTDSRSTDAIDAALRYADGEITRDELTDAAYYSACFAFHDSNANIYENAAYAAYSAAYAEANAYAAASAAAAAVAYAAAAAVAYAASASNSEKKVERAKSANRLQTANICRKVLTDAIMEKMEEIKKIQTTAL